MRREWVDDGDGVRGVFAAPVRATRLTSADWGGPPAPSCTHSSLYGPFRHAMSSRLDALTSSLPAVASV